jgi:putative hydrolase of the HAD superfamily
LSVIEIFMTRSIAGMADADPIDIVLFDLGGVLVDPGGVEPMRRLSGLESEEEVWARWLACRWVRQFERGHCSPAEFAAGVVADWGLELEPDAFLAEFGSWTGRAFPGALEFVRAVREQVPVACLSNMNAVQWLAHYDGTPLLDEFEYRFLSFELGMVKPDAETFLAVAERMPAPPERVFFVDDNAVNVEAAAAAGFVSRRARGVDEARAALREVGIPAG